MREQEIQKLVTDLFNRHGLVEWTMVFDRAVSRFGQCQHDYKRISLSRPLSLINGEEKVRNVVLHEIAHALVGPGFGHSHVWKRKAREIGCDGKRCYPADVVKPKEKFNWKAVCGNCGHESFRVKNVRHDDAISCGKCCNKYNGGHFSFKYQLNYNRN